MLISFNLESPWILALVKFWNKNNNTWLQKALDDRKQPSKETKTFSVYHRYCYSMLTTNKRRRRILSWFFGTCRRSVTILCNTYLRNGLYAKKKKNKNDTISRPSYRNSDEIQYLVNTYIRSNRGSHTSMVITILYCVVSLGIRKKINTLKEKWESLVCIYRTTGSLILQYRTKIYPKKVCFFG